MAKVTFGQLEGSEGGSHANLGGKGSSGEGNLRCKGPGAGTGLECCMARQSPSVHGGPSV